MFRTLLAVTAVAFAFGAALYFGGGALDAWESPETARADAPPARRAKSTGQSRPARKPVRSSWLTELNRLCLRTRADADRVAPPMSAEDAAGYFDEIADLNRRSNAQAAALLRRAPRAHRQPAGRLISLLRQEEALMQQVVAAARTGRYDEARRLAGPLLGIARAENDVLRRLGARDCTVAAPDLRL